MVYTRFQHVPRLAEAIRLSAKNNNLLYFYNFRVCIFMYHVSVHEFQGFAETVGVWSAGGCLSIYFISSLIQT